MNAAGAFVSIGSSFSSEDNGKSPEVSMADDFTEVLFCQ